MRKTITLVPDGWACSYEDCPPGYFTAARGSEAYLWFKTEYVREDGTGMQGYNEAGESLSISNEEMVQPVSMKWMDID